MLSAWLSSTLSDGSKTRAVIHAIDIRYEERPTENHVREITEAVERRCHEHQILGYAREAEMSASSRR